MERSTALALLACLLLAPAAWSADRGPVLRKAIGPVYPEGALPLAPDNTIIAGIRVSADGDVEDVRVLHSEHAGLGFEDAATAAVRQWNFRPARENGKKVSAFEVVRLEFVAPSGVVPRTAQHGALGLSGYGAVNVHGVPSPERWPICSGPGSCLGPTGAVWDSSWFLTHDQWVSWVLLNHPNIRANFIVPHSTRAALPYKQPSEDNVGLQPGGFLYSSWERYQEGVGPMVENVGGIGTAKSNELNYPAFRANRPRVLYKDLLASNTAGSGTLISPGQRFVTTGTMRFAASRASSAGSRTVSAGTSASAVRATSTSTTRQASTTKSSGTRTASQKRSASNTRGTKR